MKLNKKVETALNSQINAEFYSAYIYLSMAVYFENANLKGFANWMNVQAHEEWEHGKKILDYILERGGQVSLKAIEKPPVKWKSPLAVFQDAYNHEQKVTRLIENLYKLAKSEKDYATEIMLQWFITEQVEEEASASEIVEKLKLVENKENGLLMLDRELAQRGK